jgi:hypothetical protein
MHRTVERATSSPVMTIEERGVGLKLSGYGRLSIAITDAALDRVAWGIGVAKRSNRELARRTRLFGAAAVPFLRYDLRMSYRFRVTAQRSIDPLELCEALELGDLRGQPEPDAEPEQVMSLYRDKLSTRLTEVEWSDGELSVVIRALASREDCALAVRVASAAAQLAGADRVATEHFGDVPVSMLAERHGAAWMTEFAASAAGSLVALIRQGRGPMTIPGPIRPCCVGERSIAALEREGTQGTMADKLIELMRHVQWDVPPSFRDAGVFVSGEGKTQTRFAVWLPGEDLVIPNVHFVAVHAGANDTILVKSSAVPDLAGAACEALDECQWLVHATHEDDWDLVVERARALQHRD